MKDRQGIVNMLGRTVNSAFVDRWNELHGTDIRASVHAVRKADETIWRTQISRIAFALGAVAVSVAAGMWKDSPIGSPVMSGIAAVLAILLWLVFSVLIHNLEVESSPDRRAVDEITESLLSLQDQLGISAGHLIVIDHLISLKSMCEGGIIDGTVKLLEAERDEDRKSQATIKAKIHRAIHELSILGLARKELKYYFDKAHERIHKRA